MPKSEVRQAIRDYLNPEVAGITYLGTVYEALPKVANESDLFNLVPPGAGVGAVIYFFVSRQNERRIAIGGQSNGRKWRQYTVNFLCIFKSDLPDSRAGQVGFDSFFDSFTARIQASRQAGAPGVIFQWGEGGEDGGNDLDFEFPIPRTRDGGVMLFQAIGTVIAAEVLTT